MKGVKNIIFMEEKNVKISLTTVILTIFVIIIAVSLVIIATILITNKKEEKKLQQNETQNSIALQQNTNQLEKNNSKEEMNAQNNKNNNQIFDFEFNQYTEINLNNKNKVVKLKQIRPISSDAEEQDYGIKIQIAIDDSSYKDLYEYEIYDDSLPKIEKVKSKEGKEYIAILNNYNWTNNYIKIFDENCDLIGEVKYLGATSFVVENDIKSNYELELNSIYVYNFISEGKFALYEYTIENNKIVENIIETYQDDIESGTYISGRS